MIPQIKPRTLVFSLGVMLLAIGLFPQIANTQERSSLLGGLLGEGLLGEGLLGEKFLRVENPIEGSYIVVLKDPVNDPVNNLVNNLLNNLVVNDLVNDLGLSTTIQAIQLVANELLQGKGEITFIYGVLNGFAARLSEADALRLSLDPRVKYVEQDGIVSTVATQTNPTWGLDRIDQRSLPLNATYNYNTGAGVNAYVIDTGILTTHSDFSGRAIAAYNGVNDGNGSTDCNGHGTHVAGTIGSNTYGVAKSVSLYSVRVLDCSGGGSTSGVIAGVEWVTANHIKPAVANVSLGGSSSPSLDNAVRNSISAGVTYVVAAGNNNGRDARLYSPARVTEALTVGATDRNDRRATFSNIGSLVDIFAPGEEITSTWSNGSTNTISGTSMASPHVAGVAALYLQNNPTALPTTVNNAIVQSATPNKVTNPGRNTPNRLLYFEPSP